MASAPPFVDELWTALGGPLELTDALTVTGTGDLPSAYRVTDLASAAIGVAGLAAAELVAATGADAAPGVRVDRALASSWYGSAIAPVGWRMPAVWDPLARNYRTRDGWVRLHTNAPHHRRAALAVLRSADDYASVSRAVSRWDAVELESAIVDAGGCAAAMHTVDQWSRHPQGIAVAGEPLLARSVADTGSTGEHWHPTADRPLAGLRVLDLTRVIAGPVATRFLAGLGADVLRIDPPGWDENALVSNMTMGKRAARLDAGTPPGLERMTQLIAGCDVLVHGYRNGALGSLGLESDERRRLRPGLVEASLDAYGFTGPWSHRRGFDSLVQMSSGIAARGMSWAASDEPTPLPVQALDHSTGYVLAAAVLRGITDRVATGRGSASRTSLARIGRLLVEGGESPPDAPVLDRIDPSVPLRTPWGDARMLHPPVEIDSVRFAFDRPPRELGSDDASWT